jgi:tRNA dimethylallyltransferase
MNRRLIAIVGPTAAGKTDLAVDVAEDVSGEIVNVDSRQVYRGMDIGTGKPSVSIRGRIPLARYLDESREAINQIHGRNNPVIVVGGTGQYFWALVEGWNVPRVPPNPELRARLTEEAEVNGPASLHASLEALDPSASTSIDQNNIRRIVRALEVIDATGRPFSEQRLAERPPWDVTILGLTLPRPELDVRIDERIALQMHLGWVDEVRSLFENGYSANLPAFGSLGYREIAALVKGDLTGSDAIERISLVTRRFAHRQYAWFRHDDRRIFWIDVANPSQTAATALSHIETAR